MIVVIVAAAMGVSGRGVGADPTPSSSAPATGPIVTVPATDPPPPTTTTTVPATTGTTAPVATTTVPSASATTGSTVATGPSTVPITHLPPADASGAQQAVNSHQVEIDSNINALAATQQQLENALALLQANVQQQESRLTKAKHAVGVAQVSYDKAERSISVQTGRLRTLRSLMAQFAVQDYVEPQGQSLNLLLESESLTEDLEHDGLIRIKSDEVAQVTRQLKATKSRLETQRRAAAKARTKATSERAAVESQIRKVRAAQAAEQKLAKGVQDRIDVDLAQAIVLASANKLLSVEVALQQATLEARLIGLQQQTNFAGATGYGNGGAEGAPLSGGGAGSSSGSSLLQLCSVGGITVNCLISTQLQDMILAAARQGIVLTGGGYRSAAAQIALREQHCGTSEYAVFEAPASSCSPPTAVPGQSMHEVGLAIDFNACDSHSTAVWQWLNTNAATFGFFNLPAEPWHWSINGN